MIRCEGPAAGITIALLVLWAVLAREAMRAWQARAVAAEAIIRAERRKRSQATARGNRTRGEIRRARAQAADHEEHSRMAASEPALPFGREHEDHPHG